MRYLILLFLVVAFTQSDGLAAASALELDEVLTSVEREFPLVKRAQFEIQKSESDFVAAKGGFDPLVKVTGWNMPKGKFENRYFEGLVEQRTPLWGARVFGGYQSGQGQFGPYQSQYKTSTDGEWRLGAVVPLLRDGFADSMRTRISTASLGVDLSEAALRAQVLENKRLAAHRYFDWVVACERFRITDALLVLALERDRALELRVKKGDAAVIERIDNERSVLQREAAKISAERAVQKAGLELSLFYRDQNGYPSIPNQARCPSASLVTGSVLEQMEKLEWQERAKNLGMRQSRRALSGVAKQPSDTGSAESNPARTPSVSGLNVAQFVSIDLLKSLKEELRHTLERVIPNELLPSGGGSEVRSGDSLINASSINTSSANAEAAAGQHLEVVTNLVLTHPETQRLSFQRDQFDFEQSLALSQLLPKLDAEFGYAKEISFPNTPEFKVALKFEMPLFFRSGRGRYGSVAASRAQVETQLQLQKDRLYVTIKDSLQALLASGERVKKTDEEVRLSFKVEEAERIRFRHGDSNIFLVNQREQTTADARFRLVDAILDYFRAAADLKAATGKF